MSRFKGLNFSDLLGPSAKEGGEHGKLIREGGLGFAEGLEEDGIFG